MDEIEQLKQAISALETQRAVLGDAVIEAGLAPIRARLEQLQAQEKIEQRKLLTVLFADLAGYTAMSEEMDPEDVREITTAYFERWTEAIERYSGVVEKFIGDAVVAVFGLIVSREDDPENAIRAALAIKSRLDELNNELETKHGIRLKIRVGIHTGPVVVSTLGERYMRTGGQDFVAVGDTMNLASRLQAAAPENGILISHDTYRHVRGVFEVQVLDPIHVKGKKGAIQVYLVQSAKPRAFRSLTRGVEGIETRMVGRDREIASLQRALRTVMQDGERQMVTIIGEAGIGKSRLINEFDNWLDLMSEEVFYFKGRAGPAMQYQAYSLLRDLLSYRFQIQDSDPLDVVQQKIVNEIGNEEQALWIGQLIGFDFDPSGPTGAMRDASQSRDLAVEALRSYLGDLAEQDAVVLLLEDLHWADDSSLDVIESLTKTLAHHRLFILCAARPILFERRPAWGEGPKGFLHLTLQPLSEQDSHRLVMEILQRIDDLPDSLSEIVIRNAEGNPFYIEELIKILIEDGVILRGDERWSVDLSRLPSIRVPPTLTEVLQARLDGLPVAERSLLQRASVIGRIFWDHAVEALETDAPEGIGNEKVDQFRKVAEILEELRGREMIYKRSDSSFETANEYLFKHTLLRDVTYEGLLRRLRRVYHARAARWLERATQNTERANQYAASIAEHYDQAGETGPAIDWYQRAGVFAASHFANAEAVRCFSRCLDMLGEENPVKKYEILQAREQVYHLQGNRQAQSQDLHALEDLLIRLPGEVDRIDLKAELALRWAKMEDITGNYSAAIIHAQDAVTLAHSAGDIQREAWGTLRWGQSLWHQADYVDARARTERALMLARQANLRELEADSLRQLGVIADATGEYARAVEYLQPSLKIYQEMNDRRGESVALNSLGVVAFHRGDYAEARPYYDQALKLKRQLGDRHGEGVLLNNLGIIAHQQKDIQASQQYFECCLQICQEIEDSEGVAAASNGLGSVAFSIGHYAEARQYQSQALRICLEIGDREGESDVLTSLSEGCVYLERAEESLEYARQAFQISQEIGGLSVESYSLANMGNALLKLGRLEEAVEAFQKALEICPDLSQTNQTIEILAGLARVQFARGELDEAARTVDEILKHQASRGVEATHPDLRVDLACYQVLQTMQDPRAAEVLHMAYQALQDQANRITDEGMRRSFLENVPYHRELAALWTGRKTASTSS